jgi:hypothetical protein
MFRSENVVQIYDHSEPMYNGKMGIIRRVETIRGHTYYMVEINNRLVPCTADELIEY